MVAGIQSSAWLGEEGNTSMRKRSGPELSPFDCDCVDVGCDLEMSLLIPARVGFVKAWIFLIRERVCRRPKVGDV
jgi:hypothetical protein